MTRQSKHELQKQISILRDELFQARWEVSALGHSLEEVLPDELTPRTTYAPHLPGSLKWDFSKIHEAAKVAKNAKSGYSEANILAIVKRMKGEEQ